MDTLITTMKINTKTNVLTLTKGMSVTKKKKDKKKA